MQRIISVHEAAHAVVAWLWNVPFTKVTITPGLQNYMRGYLEFSEWHHEQAVVTPEQKSENLARCKVLLAGPAAEEKIQGHYDPDRATNDLEMTHEILGTLYKERL